jgi:hypothetical protein
MRNDPIWSERLLECCDFDGTWSPKDIAKELDFIISERNDTTPLFPIDILQKKVLKLVCDEHELEYNILKSFDTIAAKLSI